MAQVQPKVEMDKHEARVQVLPASGLDCGSQKCRLGKSLVRSLNCQIGDAVWIPTGGSCVLCTVWPSENGQNSFAQASTLVQQFRPENTSSGTFVNPGQIEVARSVVKAVSIEVHLVADDNKRDPQHRKCKKSSEWTARQCLRNIVISSNCVVNCHQTPTGKLLHVSHLLVNKLETDDALNVSEGVCGRICADTRVIVTRVLGRERYEQRLRLMKDAKKLRLGGLDKEIKMLMQFVKLPQLLSGDSAHVLKSLPRGLLLQGPHGCGKSSLVQHIARECDTYLITVTGSELCGDRPGETEEILGSILEKVKVASTEGPCIFFLDDLDAISPVASQKQDCFSEKKAALTLANILDKLSKVEGVSIIAASSNLGSVDPVLRRSGRLSKQVLIGIPTLVQREAILKALTCDMPIASNLSLSYIAECTPGFVGADLLSLVWNAQYKALQRYRGNESNIRVDLEDFEAALHSIQPSTQQGTDIVVDHKPVAWDDIGGLDDIKLKLRQAIEWPMRYPQSFSRLGIPCPKGVLLYGPPGCAKTTLVRAAATACHVTFLAISGGQLYSPYVGDSERKLTQVFNQARAGAPSILFIDELDSVVGGRGASDGKGVKERVLSTLLNEMDGIGHRVDDAVRSSDRVAEGQVVEGNEGKLEQAQAVDNSGVLVVAATNRPDMLDDALLRPGRLDRIIYVPPPDLKARKSILKVHTRKLPLEDELLEDVAIETEGYTGADLENVIREVVLHAMSKNGISTSSVTRDDFDDVLSKLQPSLTSAQMDSYRTLKGRLHIPSS